MNLQLYNNRRYVRKLTASLAPIIAYCTGKTPG